MVPDAVKAVAVAFGMEGEDILMPIDPEFVGALPKTIYAVKYREECQDGKWRTFIFLFASKAAYDQRIAGTERGQGLQGTVTWHELTKPVKKKKPPQAEGLF